MKNHILTLFDPAHRKLTFILFFVSVALIFASQVIGTVDNLPGILMLMAGMVSLFYSVLHPWRTTKPYAILIGACFGLIALIFVCIYILAALKLDKFISEGLVMGTIGLICIPGIIVGACSMIYLANKQPGSK